MTQHPDIRRHVLSDGDVSVAILSLGCVTQDWRVPVNGRQVPVVLGYSDPTAYCHNPQFMGAIVGRVANRTAGATFALNGSRHSLNANEASHHLHGGSGGLHTRNWASDPDGNRAVDLRYTSPDGEQGYPGNVDLRVTISLCGYRLRYEMRATVDRPTPLNLAQHSYYNLIGGGPVSDHVLQIGATGYTPVNDDKIPTGKINGLNGALFDVRRPRSIAKADPDGQGIDLNYVLAKDADTAARLTAPNGLSLRLETDQPGLQLYTGAALTQISEPLAGQEHVRCGAVCLEPQGFPDAVNQPTFPSVIVTPDRPYRQVLDVTIAPLGGSK